MIEIPNWCENTLEVEGDIKRLKEFKKFAKGKNRHGDVKILNEDAFIPYPLEYKKMDEAAHNWMKKADRFAKKCGADSYYKLNGASTKLFIDKNGEQPTDGFNSGGYNWCCNNYGTKWGFCSPVLTDNKDNLFYNFDTAWSPPIPLIKKMSEMFPDLTFKIEFDETGVDFWGIIVFKNGEIEHEESGPSKLNQEINEGDE